ncbi:hypothetical protein ACJIZ3_019310 [Penstemon smallii]|uniref:Uncharacterized protein n=1 Tax=Penstemon smallii TaxID=265156 RepID=A0ABD3T295_9LAMI
MSRIYDNWERLVRATLKRDLLRQLALQSSMESSFNSTATQSDFSDDSDNYIEFAQKQIMSSEISCGVNQLPPDLVWVNSKPLSIEELVLLQSCLNPPKKLRPGRYWYDKVSGLWGKEGEKPIQIISADLPVGYRIQQGASNGKTNVFINNREITRPEIWMLQAAGIHCEGNPSFWVSADGSYQLEGMNYVLGKLWKTKVKIVCLALSLPFPKKQMKLT